MATTRLMPLHTGKGRTVGTAIEAIIDYVENPEKTDGGNLITSWQCDSRVADREFLLLCRLKGVNTPTWISPQEYSTLRPASIEYDTLRLFPEIYFGKIKEWYMAPFCPAHNPLNFNSSHRTPSP